MNSRVDRQARQVLLRVRAITNRALALGGLVRVAAGREFHGRSPGSAAIDPAPLATSTWLASGWKSARNCTELFTSTGRICSVWMPSTSRQAPGPECTVRPRIIGPVRAHTPSLKASALKRPLTGGSLGRPVKVLTAAPRLMCMSAPTPGC